MLIADVQALTDNFEHPEKLEAEYFRGRARLPGGRASIRKRSKFVVQSMVPELTELTIYFMNLVTMATLERNPTLKEEIKQKNFSKGLPVGFYTYPISQASDITIFKAHLVPVGEDQLPMIEQAREIVRRFNRMYDKVLIEPKALRGRGGAAAGHGRRREDVEVARQLHLPRRSAGARAQARDVDVSPIRRGFIRRTRGTSRAIRCSPTTTFSIRIRPKSTS